MQQGYPPSPPPAVQQDSVGDPPKTGCLAWIKEHGVVLLLVVVLLLLAAIVLLKGSGDILEGSWAMEGVADPAKNVRLRITGTVATLFRPPNDEVGKTGSIDRDKLTITIGGTALTYVYDSIKDALTFVYPNTGGAYFTLKKV